MGSTDSASRQVSLLRSLTARPWIWSWLAAAAVFIVTTSLTQGRGAGDLAYAALSFGAFAAIVGLGQMLVITLGPGNVDLSIPAIMTLAATLGLKVMGSDPGTAFVGLGVALAVGIGAGLSNFALIYLLRLPPIIATLAASLIFQSVAIWSNRGLRIKPPRGWPISPPGGSWACPMWRWWRWCCRLRSGWCWNAACGAGGCWPRGRTCAPHGWAGIPVQAVRCATYVAVAVFASLAGYLLASFSGGAALNMGAEYLLMSIAVVVIGGTSIAGGMSNVPGIWGASLFMFLVVSMLNTYGAGAGLRMVLTGFIIIGIVIAASTRRTRA